MGRLMGSQKQLKSDMGNERFEKEQTRKMMKIVVKDSLEASGGSYICSFMIEA